MADFDKISINDTYYNVKDSALTAAVNALTSEVGEVQETVTQQGKTIDKLSTQIGKLSKFPTVKDYGAKGDGMTDDTAAIKQALDDVGCAIIPPGHYKISSLTISASATIIGFGDKSVLDAGINNTALTITNPPAAVVLEKVKIVGKVVFSDVFTATPDQNLLVDGCIIQAQCPTLSITGGREVTIRNTIFLGNSKDNITLILGSVNVSITGCLFQKDAQSQTVPDGVEIGPNGDRGSEGIRITNNTFIDLGEGVRFAGLDVDVSHNMIDQIDSNGILDRGGSSHRIIGNYIGMRGTVESTNGIMVNPPEPNGNAGITVVANRVQNSNSVGSGIYFVGIASMQLGNVVAAFNWVANVTNGLRIDYVQNSRFTNNFIVQGSVNETNSNNNIFVANLYGTDVQISGTRVPDGVG